MKLFKKCGIAAAVAAMVLAAGCSNAAGGGSSGGGGSVIRNSPAKLLADKVIGSTTCSKTGEVDVLTRTTTVSMADDSSWSGYISSSSSDYYKGVFIKDRSVTLSPFAMGKYEVTQELYNAVLAGDTDCNASPSYYSSNPASGETQNLRPVENVTWYDAVYFCNALTKKLMSESDCVYTITNITRNATSKYISSATVEMNMSKKGYRLPTEAEWEFAARGGDATAEAWKYSYAGSNTSETNLTSQTTDTALNDYGWYTSNSSSKTHEVGKKTANALGLYDMSGNVWEWCWDRYSSTVDTTAVTDPAGPAEGSNRLRRGGSWSDGACDCSVSGRSYDTPGSRYGSLGFRLARSL